jgi:hypothetical protein
MYKTLSILFLTASMAQAQTTLFCEDNFDNTSTVGCAFQANALTSFSKQNGQLSYFQVGLYQGSFNYASSNSFDDYDTLKLEMDFNLFNRSLFSKNQFIFNIYPQNIFFSYTDPLNKIHTGTLTENPIPQTFNLGATTSSAYDSTTKKLILNFANPTNSNVMFGSFQTYNTHFYSSASWGEIVPGLVGNYFISASDDANFLNNAKQSFCATMSNPSDCQTKVTTNTMLINNINFTIDNFKAYGIKKVVTGFEEEIKPLNTRILLGMYNLLGQKLDADQTHEGVVIKIYSDGTEEKIVMN